MKLFNSMHNKIEELKTIKENEVSMYVCGPTVYNYPHIGNARPIIVFDTLINVLEALKYKVTFVSNYTDVDDKIINTAIKEGKSEEEVSEFFINAYNSDRLALNARMPDIAPKVTQTMDEIIEFIQLLINKGYGYQADGDVYFRVGKINEYGKLSNQKIDDLVVGARIDENSNKENPLDFTLWKKTDVGINWDSPWSKGRPGWHSECVVMINKQFSEHLIDIHGGGMDLKFPHHENEIAQSIGAYDTNIANYWIHNGMVNINGDKMSKSIGNVLWVKDLIKEHGGNVIRWMMLSAHYRSPINISDETLDAAKKELDKVINALKIASLKLQLNNYESDELDSALYNEFLQAMSDDLNTPNGFKAVFETNKKLNNELRNKEMNNEEIAKLKNSLSQMMKVLGIKIEDVILSNEDKELYNKWEQEKANRNFDKADEIRKVLLDKGIL